MRKIRSKKTVLAMVISMAALAAPAAFAQGAAATMPAASPAAPAGGQTSSVLPYPDFHFTGKIGDTFEQSDPATFPQPVKPPKGAPNVLLIMLDDVGFGQFDLTGGGVPSPNMDKLAHEGLLYNRFHTTAMCSPSRAALITGRDSHVVGNGILTEMGTGYDGYTSVIPRSAATVGEVLRQNGYATAWLGKNHNTPPWETSEIGPFDHWPTGWGFEYFYGFNAADSSQLQPILYENHTRVPASSDPSYHLTTDLADHAIDWIHKEKAIAPDKPFFVYLAPGATHAPHQPPQAWIDKYKGQFDMGWDKYREMTLERQKKLGIVPQNTDLTARPDGIPAWDSLEPQQKKLYARMMEIYAAYGAHADYEMGRVIDAVKKLPDADNTMIVYVVGDNGSSAEGGLGGSTDELIIVNGMQQDWQDVYKVMNELGGPRHFNHMPIGWAHAMNTPFQWTKQVASHFGGTRNPLIIDWPAGIKQGGAIRPQFSHITDIMPTILDAAHVTVPTKVNGVDQTPLDGISLAYTFNDPNAPDRRHSQMFELLINRGIYQDGWMASSLAFNPLQVVRGHVDISNIKWELYNINEDFSQAHNVADQHPEKVKQLEALWWEQAKTHNVLPLDWRGPERFSNELTGRPNLAAGRKTFVYDYPLVGLPEGSAPDLKNKSFTVTAETQIPQDGANGMIFTQGGFTAGWGFYVQQGKLVVAHNFVDLERYRIVSTGSVPTGKVTLSFHFQYDGGGLGKGGTVTMFANGKQIGEGRIEKTVPMKYTSSETQDIGEDAGTPVDNTYKPPFKFNGKIDRLTVELQ
ncbi:arylsulfatase [Paraburkholderia edwinii]|nr:arylsulfatase [Paraburkholderia edwinii]